MSVKPHPTIEGAWQIEWWIPDTGKPKNKSGKYPLKRKSEAYIGEYADACSRWTSLCQAHKTNKTIGNPRLNDVIPSYLQYIELNKSRGYHKSICWAMVKLKPHFGNYPVSNITRELIESFKKKHQKTPRHANQCLEYLKILINYMVERQQAQPLPFKIVKLNYEERIPQPPSPAEWEKILNTIRENFRKSGSNAIERALKESMLIIMYATGIRMNECRHLQWQNLRWDDGRILVTNTKTKRQRFAVIPDEALNLLDPFKQKSGYIFINPRTGKPYTDIGKMIKNAAEKHNIPMRGAHDLRHAAGTDTLEATGDIRATQDLLGHADIKSTQRYTHIAIERQQRIAQQTALFRKQQRDIAKETPENRKQPK